MPFLTPRTALVWGALLLTPITARAQQRPLATEDPETIGAGRVLIETGVDFERDVVLPVSGLRGDVFTVVPGVSIGFSSIAEIQLDGGLYQRMSITGRSDAPFSPILAIDGNTTADSDDLSIGAKVRFLSETRRRPAMAFRFSTRLPNASNESGLGRDTTDFVASVLVGKTIQSIRIVVNGGLQILDDPTQPARQDDLLIGGVSLARAVTASTEVVGELFGRVNFSETITPGAESRGLFRLGARYTRGSVRLDAAVLLGATIHDPELGFTTGLTWVFKAFTVP